jgi:hypothetical protein
MRIKGCLEHGGGSSKEKKKVDGIGVKANEKKN